MNSENKCCVLTSTAAIEVEIQSGLISLINPDIVYLMVFNHNYGLFAVER